MEWTTKAKSIDFVRLEQLVRERITILRHYVDAIGKTGIDEVDPRANELICRDLIFPNIGLLAQFIDSVNLGEEVEK